MSRYADEIEELRRRGQVHESGTLKSQETFQALVSETQKGYEEPAPVSVLQDIENQIRNAHSSLLDTLNRLSDLGDRIFGVQPECDQNEALHRNPDCAEDRVKDALHSLHAVTALMDEAQRRIDRIA